MEAESPNPTNSSKSGHRGNCFKQFLKLFLMFFCGFFAETPNQGKMMDFIRIKINHDKNL